VFVFYEIKSAQNFYRLKLNGHNFIEAGKKFNILQKYNLLELHECHDRAKYLIL